VTAPPRFVPGAGTGTPATADTCLVVAGRRLLVTVDGGFPRASDLPKGIQWYALGTLDGSPVWAGDLPAEVPHLGTWRGWPSLAARLGEPLAALAGRALQVMTWRRTHRFCGGCRAELTDVPGEHARRCPGCALYVPMQLSPAVLVAVRRATPAGPALLLIRHTHGPDLWALVAGFVEAGESLEEAARREVAEEVGLRLGELRYFGSQPWALSGPGVVLVGFHATCADDAAEPVPDGREVAEARWFPQDALPAELPPAFSLSRWLIDAAAPD
jgi:NAD+ diphosphatase